MSDPSLYETVMAIAFSTHARQLLTAALVGYCIGLERELKTKPASLRTFSMICTGSCLFSILSLETAGSVGGGPYDQTRIAAQIVTGVGFLGGGVIFKTTDRIEGITTAALIWLTAALGMAVGFGRTDIAIIAVIIGAAINLISYLTYRVLFHFRQKKE